MAGPIIQPPLVVRKSKTSVTRQKPIDIKDAKGDLEMDSTLIYQETSVTTQDSGQLVVLLYDGAIKFLRQAITSIEQGDMEKKGQLVGKAKDIIFELNTVLDMQAGGQITQNLRKLYNFMGRHLIQANIKRDPQMIQEVIELLEELNKGWKAVAT